MSKAKTHSHHYGKPILYAVLALVAGVAFLVASQLLRPKGGAQTPTTMAASAPADDRLPAGPGHPPRRSRDEVAAQNLAGLLLLFSVASFVFCVVCIGWLVYKIRQAQPAWQRQTKYPKMRKD
jgi:hypothetical protein